MATLRLGRRGGWHRYSRFSVHQQHPSPEAPRAGIIVPKLLERAVLLWERALSDTRRPLFPFRTKSKAEGHLPDCLFAEADELDQGSDEEYDRDGDARLSKKSLKLPDAKEEYTGVLDVMKTPTVSLKGTTMQCIIKLVNLVLTPEKPEYPGGKWHVEGWWVITPDRNSSLTLRIQGWKTSILFRVSYVYALCLTTTLRLTTNSIHSTTTVKT